jgi:putative heme-binding domain-containing protein
MVSLTEGMSKGRLGVPGRLHAVWVLGHVGGPAALEPLFDLARTDPESRVRAQAVRALADLTDPVLTRHRLDAGPGDVPTAARLAALARGQEPAVLLEVVIALGRLRWSGTARWLEKNMSKPDAALAHAAMQALRRSENWPAVLEWIDRPTGDPLRAIALRALGGQAVPALVDGLIERLRRETDPGRRREYADALTRVYKKPGPWAYWGFRAPPRPPNTAAWDRTEAIGQALDRSLADPDRAGRLAVLGRMQREKIPARLETLAQWLRDEKAAEAITAILGSLRDQPAAATRELLEGLVAGGKNPLPARLAALATWVAGLDGASEGRLLAVAGSIEDGPVLAEVLRQIGKRPKLRAGPLLLSKLDSPAAAVRAGALEALAQVEPGGGGRPPVGAALNKLLEDKDARVRRAAAGAAGKLGARTAAAPLLNLVRDPEPEVRRASLESLRLLKEPRAVPFAVAALADPEAAGAALRCISDLGGPGQLEPVVELARRNPSAEVLPLVLRLLTDWGNRPGAGRGALDLAVADLQGSSGTLGRWNATVPLGTDAAVRLVERLARVPDRPEAGLQEGGPWQTVFATGADSRLRLAATPAAPADARRLVYTEVRVGAPTSVQFLGASTVAVRVWLNGRQVFQRDGPRPFQPDSERFEAVLDKGLNRVLVQLTVQKAEAEFHLRFRRKSATAEHERLAQAALTRAGNPDRGRQLFLAADKTQCLKCHRVGDQGERIGPELTGIGSRFPRIFLIESILEPSRSITPGYQTVYVTLKDGRVLTGVKVADKGGMVTVADNQGKTHALPKADIEEERPLPQSTMPEGLEKNLTVEEFVDLIAFLASQKDNRQR